MRRMDRNCLVGICAGVALMMAGCQSNGTPSDLSFSGESVQNSVGSNTVSNKVVLSVFQEASVVIGQPDFNTTEWSVTDPRANNFSSPNTSLIGNGDGGMFSNPIVVNEKLYIADYDWNRVLGFDNIPSVNGMDADFVLGQDDFNSINTGDGNSTMGGPQTIVTMDGKLFIVEWGNSQVLVYNTIPTAIGDKPDYVIGQGNFGDNDNSCTDNRLEDPESIFAVDGKLLVADSGHNRILIYNSIPAESNASADIVLGQADFTSCDENRGSGVPAADSLSYPSGIWSDGTRLVINDNKNSRVLIWNSFPTTNGQPADIVLGQNDFNMSAPNDDDQDGVADLTPSARTFSYPYIGNASNGTQLFISDTGNNRVLVWDTFPTETFQPADIVIGQSDFNLSASNDDDQNGTSDSVPSARTLNFPNGLFLYQDKLFVSDQNNGRVLIFDGQ